MRLPADSSLITLRVGRAGCGDHLSRHTVRLDRIRAHWDDMLRVAGSLTTGKVRVYDLIRILSRDGRPTGLGDAFAHYGRIFKTLHLLQFISDDGYRRVVRNSFLAPSTVVWWFALQRVGYVNRPCWRARR
jgi:TnpA family transposase